MVCFINVCDSILFVYRLSKYTNGINTVRDSQQTIKKKSVTYNITHQTNKQPGFSIGNKLSCSSNIISSVPYDCTFSYPTNTYLNTNYMYPDKLFVPNPPVF